MKLVGKVERCAGVSANICNPIGAPIAITPGDCTSYDLEVHIDGEFVRLLALPSALTCTQALDLARMLTQAAVEAHESEPRRDK